MFKNVLEVYSENLFGKIQVDFDKYVATFETKNFEDDIKIQKWLKEGNYIKRKGILDAMIGLVKVVRRKNIKLHG